VKRSNHTNVNKHAATPSSIFGGGRIEEETWFSEKDVLRE
jgi:hypothetical protein